MLTPLVRHIAIKNNWVAVPRSDRWHQKETALMGGIAIYISLIIPLFIASTPFASSMEVIFGFNRDNLPPLALAVFFGSTWLFGLGLIDDFIGIKPQTKLIGQIVVALMMAFWGFRLTWFNSLTLDTFITIFWIVGITNAFNLLDNMDGLCTGIGGICCLFLTVLFMGKMADAYQISLIMTGALFAFLVYNFNPASIFMGDCGSMLIGFVISLLSICYSQSVATNPLMSIAAPILLLMVPVLDTTLVTFIRILSGRKASMGGRDHTSHRLVLIGMSEKRAALTLYGIGIVTGLSALFVSHSDTATSPSVIIPAFFSILLMGIYLAQIRVYPEKEFSLLRNNGFSSLLYDLTYKRQVLIILMDFCLIAFSYYLSYRLRFDSKNFLVFFNTFLQSVPVVMACKLIVLYLAGTYKGFWDFISTNDTYQLVKASIMATLLSVVAVTFIYRFESFSKGVFVIDFFLTTCLLLAVRGSFRMFTDSVKRRTLEGEKVIIYGAGRGGELLLREILNNRALNVIPVGFIDDDPLKQGKKLQGYPVLGALEDLSHLKEKHNLNGILVSFNPNGNQKHARIVAYGQDCGLFVKQFQIQINTLVPNINGNTSLEKKDVDIVQSRTIN
ncbi:MAG: glycosyl transferase [Desulfobacteraceae bacterium]